MKLYKKEYGNEILMVCGRLNPAFTTELDSNETRYNLQECSIREDRVIREIVRLKGRSFEMQSPSNRSSMSGMIIDFKN